ncbi:MAG: hypothetical protein ABL940_13305 [Bacteroidia bacterium]
MIRAFVAKPNQHVLKLIAKNALIKTDKKNINKLARNDSCIRGKT